MPFFVEGLNLEFGVVFCVQLYIKSFTLLVHVWTGYAHSRLETKVEFKHSTPHLQPKITNDQLEHFFIKCRCIQRINAGFVSGYQVSSAADSLPLFPQHCKKKDVESFPAIQASHDVFLQ